MEHSHPMTEERMALIIDIWSVRGKLPINHAEVKLLHRLIDSSQSYYTYTDRNQLTVIRTKYIKYLQRKKLDDMVEGLADLTR